ncbi:MAG TPA: Rieske 2Fe-2S domain-containing protein [Chitinophagales bacterium]|nr:Rieske 2Fe-2S domain-containing protein [Chitinophagales bacterium]
MIKDQWYIACFLNELEKTNIIKKKIVGEEIVVFKNSDGDIAVLEDRCCHRNVHLSNGTVHGKNIKCGYHGWEYNTDGKCAHIPMLENKDHIPKKACVGKYPMQIKYQAVWVYFGDQAIMHEAEIPEMEELDNLPFVHNAHILTASIKLVAESLFDAQHINHVHKNTINTLLGKLREPKTEYEIDIQKTSLFGSYKRINNSSVFEKVYFGWDSHIDTKFAYWYPHTSKLDSHFPKHMHFPARRLVIYEHFYEIEPNKIMMIQITAWKNIFRFNPPFARWFMKRKSDQIVSEDIVFLESNLHWHQKIEVNDLIIKGDEPTLSFMQLWNKNFNKKANEKLD